MKVESVKRIETGLSYWSLLAVALLPALVLCVFGPSNLYFSNAREFDTAYADLLPGLITFGLAVAIAVAGIGRLLSPAWRRRYASMVFALGLLLWIQGAFLMHSYGELDGRGMQFEAVPGIASTDILLWIVGLIFAVVFAGRILQVAAFGSLVLLSLQSVALVITIAGDDPVAKSTPAGTPPDAIFHLSRDRNIFHIVLDNFQTDVFQELVEERGLGDRFDGFMLFEDNTAVAPHTSLAVPAILSGEIYDGSQPPSAYYQQAVETGFHNTLFEYDYTVNLVPLQSMREGRFSNYYEVPAVYAGSPRDRLLSDLAQLLDVSLFRHSPHSARPWVYNDNNWRIRPLVWNSGGGTGFHHRRFFHHYIDAIEVAIDGPAYHLVHLWPPHPPFTTTNTGEDAGKALPNTRENYLNEARPVVAMLVEFMDRLKALGVYDDALVIVQSDHGGGFEPDIMPRRLLGLLAVKQPGSRGPLQRSEAPTTVADVAATIMQYADIEHYRHGGRSVFELDGTERIRQFVFLHDGELYRIDIAGSPHDPASLDDPRRVEMAADTREYSYGSQELVGLMGGGGKYLVEGWTSPADRHVWSHGNVATMQLVVQPPNHNLRLSIDLIPHVHPEALPEQRVEILVNGRTLLTWTGHEKRKQELTSTIPRDWVTDSELLIQFNLPDAASPAELGTGTDDRNLGIALIGFSIEQEAESSID